MIKRSIDSQTLGTIYIIFSVAVALVGVGGSSFYIYELYLGRVALAPFITFFGVVLAAVGSFINGELNRRNSTKNAEMTQTQVQTVADVTQSKVEDGIQKTQETINILHDGLPERVATLTATKIVDAGAATHGQSLAAINTNQQAIMALITHLAGLAAPVTDGPQPVTIVATEPVPVVMTPPTEKLP